MNFSLTEMYTNERSVLIMKEMLGNMKPNEIVDLISDRRVRRTDVPNWVEATLRQHCKILVSRLVRYDQKIRRKFGRFPSLVKIIKEYHGIWDNWDSLEPFPYTEMKPIKCYYDEAARSPRR